jgi:GT2 family glycosyltransferase
MSVAIVLLTFNRLPLIRQCVENVLGRVSDQTSEIVIWDNGSDDGTGDFLATLDDPRVRIVSSPRNVGMNAYRQAIELTTAPYLIQLDDDVVDAPLHWDAVLLAAIKRLPDVGFLGADVIADPNDRVSFDRYHTLSYVERSENGVRLLEGPTGGWCTITPRAVYDEVGGLPLKRRRTYFSTDTAYVNALEEHGYRRALLADLKVKHSGDPPGRPVKPEKARYFARERRVQRLKDLVKRALLGVPGVRRLNERRGWFEAPPSAHGGGPSA